MTVDEAARAEQIGRAAQIAHRLALLEAYVREQGLAPVQPPAMPSGQDATVATLGCAGPGDPKMERQWQLLEHYVAVLEQRKRRAEQVERGEDPGPRLHLIAGGTGEPTVAP